MNVLPRPATAHADPVAMPAAPRALPEDSFDACAATLAVAVVLERGAPVTWRAAPVRHGLSSAIIDAVMTPRVLTRTVDAVVDRHEAAFGAGTASELVHAFEILGDAGWRREIGTAHRTHARIDAPHKSAVIAQGAALLAERGVETSAQLRSCAQDETLRALWCALPAQRTGFTWRHLLMAAGHDELIVCPLTRRFARRSTGHDFSDADLVDVINRAAAHLDVTPVALEHQMWRGALTTGRARKEAGGGSEHADIADVAADGSTPPLPAQENDGAEMVGQDDTDAEALTNAAPLDNRLEGDPA